ncbi:uncharacterized protein BDV17DRAFT_233444 [Aspergillus undulatus]|uniref:uncharacterized protein n=1 Tax=Aspergillus undulatus TaxID=1810928 RepID=UPI003CCD9369
MSLAYTTYVLLATTVASYPLANGLLIFLCSLPPVLFASHYRNNNITTNDNNKSQTQSQSRGGLEACRCRCRYYHHHYRYPLWLSLLLPASASLDLSLIFALHPVTIAYPYPTETDSAKLPSPDRFMLQVLGFFVMEGVCRRFLVAPLVSSVTTRLHHEQGQEANNAADDGDDIATAAIVDFSTPRIALILGIAVLGVPCWLTRRLGLGRLHPLSMAGWVIIDQNLSTLGRCNCKRG